MGFVAVCAWGKEDLMCPLDVKTAMFGILKALECGHKTFC